MMGPDDPGAPFEPRGARALRACAWTVLAAFAFVPLAFLAARSFSPEAWIDLATPRVARLFVESLGMAAGAAAIATALGSALAFLLETRRVPFRPALRLAALAPLIFPPFLQVAVWRPILVGRAVADDPVRVLATVLVLGFCQAPLVFFFASQGIRSIAGAVLDAARLEPVPERNVALRIILPLAAPAIGAGAAVAFVLSFLDQETPSLLGVISYATEIFTRYSRSPGAAFAASLPVLAVSLAVVAAGERWADRRGFRSTAGENRGAQAPGRRPSPLALLAIAAFAGILVVFPIVRLFFMARSLETFGRALDLYRGDLLEGIPVTLGAAVLATVLAAMALGRRARPSLAAALAAWLPLAVPGTALGRALIETWNRPVLEAVYGTPWILVIAGAARFFPIAYFALAAHLRTVPRELWEAADLEGAPLATRLFRVYLPLALPGLALAATGVILLGSAELGAALLIAPPGHVPVPVAISSELHYNVDLDVPAALCLFQAAAVTASVIFIRAAARLADASKGGP
jgi:iron(III) transport system permease protein